MGESEITLPLLTKLGFVAAIWLALPLKHALAVTFLLIVCYRYAVAIVFGLQVMDIMDLNTFSTSEKATVNSISMTIVSKSEKAHANEVFGRLAHVHRKMRSKIVTVFGDLYYKEISEEETMKACLEFLPPNTIKNKADVESFAGLQLGKAFPLDRPQWQVWV